MITRTLFLAGVVTLAPLPLEGEWVREDGVVEMKPCEPWVTKDKIRMPKGCVAPMAGVLLTRSYFMALEMDKVERDKVVKGQEEVIRDLKARISDLEMQIKVGVVAPDCNCPSTLTPYLTASIGLGAGLMSCAIAGVIIK